MKGVQQISIETDDADQRLDRWLRHKFPNVRQSRIEKICRKGELRVDGGRVKPSFRLQVGQVVRIPPFPKEADKPAPAHTQAPYEISPADAHMIQAAVIYRDADIIALNKPAGLPVQGGTGVLRHVDALSSALQFDLPEPPRLVHRLDKDTSGVLLLARTRTMARHLTAAIRHRQTRKIYWALVAGVPKPYLGEVRYGLRKAGGSGPEGQGEKMIAVAPRDIDSTPDAKRAHTLYATLYRVAQRAAWVAMEPITGRTHQLRVHMSHIGHPIIGDGKYATSAQENLGDGWGAQIGGVISKKMHLHARSMTFEHPIKRKIVTITAPLPAHMAHTWETLGWDETLGDGDPFKDII